MKIENIRIAKSAITDTVFAGILDSSGITWKCKKDVTNDFYLAVIDMWQGTRQRISNSEGVYEIIVRKVK